MIENSISGTTIQGYFTRVNITRVIFSLATLLAFTPVITRADSDNEKNSIKTYAYADFGYWNELQNSRGEARPAEHVTMFLGGAKFSSLINENFKVFFTPEFQSSTSLPQYPNGRQDFGDPPAFENSAYIEQFKGTWTFGDPERPDWQITLGHQYIKDNPHGKLLGDYLYRSRIYPSMPVTGILKSRAKILGLRVMKTHGEIFSHNFIIHSKRNYYPYGDISLAYSATVKVRMFEVGAGINWVSAIPIRPSRTTPAGEESFDINDNTYKEVPFQTGTLVSDTSGPIKSITLNPIAGSDTTAELIIDDLEGTPASVSTDTIPMINGKVAGLSDGPTAINGGLQNTAALTPLTIEGSGYRLYPELKGKEIKYSYSGQIVNLRAAVNPLAHNPDLLGKDALKLYLEAAVLGWKNYPYFYEERSERTAIMGGVNLPTFNFLDHLVAEVEYFPSKRPATWRYAETKNIPQPGAGIDLAGRFDADYLDPDRHKRDDWKWILSVRKNFNEGFGIWAQGGTDHLHSVTTYEKYNELSSTPSQWYVMFRLVFKTTI